MPDCQCIDQVESQTKSLPTDATRVFGAVKSFRQVGLSLAWDTNALILYRHFYEITRYVSNRYRDLATMGAVADSIAQQICQHLFQATFVPLYHHGRHTCLLICSWLYSLPCDEQA